MMSMMQESLFSAARSLGVSSGSGWLTMVASLSLMLSAISAGIILIDILGGRHQKMMIMNLVWPITALYSGPIGLWAYYSMGRAAPHGGEPAHEEGAAQAHGEDHDKPQKPFWQTVFKATSHCGAGCTLGDTIGEWGIFLLGITWFGSKLMTMYVVDFTLAYVFGIVFQYFTIAPMRHLGFKEGVWAAVKADTISLVAFEIGMFAFMALNQLVFFSEPPEPSSAVYWFMMQLAMIAGFLTSYPANWWLVKSGMKEAM